jgi:hypothetical protein
LNAESQNQDRQRERAEEYQRYSAYQSIRQRLGEVRETDRLRTSEALTRTGITDPARLYGREKDSLPRAFVAAMQRLWDIGTLPEGRADTELRRTYHLVAKGRAPLSVQEVIYLGKLPDVELIPLLGWLAHRMSLAETWKKVAAGLCAPPVVGIEEENCDA